jgi:hypothetical protein
MTLDDAYEKALCGPNPVEQLRSLAVDLLSLGHGRSEIVTSLQVFARQLRIEERESEEEAVLDVLDCLVGWCAPHMDVEAISGAETAEGRTKIYKSMVKEENTLEAGTPASFDVLTNEIDGLGLNMQLEKKRI